MERASAGGMVCSGWLDSCTSVEPQSVGHSNAQAEYDGLAYARGLGEMRIWMVHQPMPSAVGR